MSHRLLKYYGLLVGLSLLLKVPLAIYNFEYGFREHDFTLVNIDGLGYVQRAISGELDLRVGGHWLYELINMAVLQVSGPDHLYLAMSLLNILLSSLLPLALMPATRVFGLSDRMHERHFLLLSALLLFWPTSIWLSTQNLKDVLLSILFAAFVSLMVLAFTSRPGIALLSIGLAVLDLYLTFSLRSYLAVFMSLSVGVFVLAKYRSPAVLAGTALIGALIFASPFGGFILDFLSPERNWLLNAEAAAELQKELLENGEAGLTLATSPAAFATGLVRTVLNPFPRLMAENVHQVLLSLKTVCVTAFLGFVLLNLLRWRSPFRLLFVLLMTLPLTFFSIVQSYSGPRQVFSSIEVVFLLLLSYFLVTPRRTTLRFSLLAGMVLSMVLLLFTSKEFIG